MSPVFLRRAFCVLLAWTVSLSTAVTSVCAEDEALDRDELDLAYVRRLSALADKCRQSELSREADISARWFVPRDPRRQYLFLVPDGPDPTRPADDRPELARKWYAAFRKAREARADSLFDFARSALEAGRLETAYQAVFEVLRENPDHTRARAVLGYRNRDGLWYHAAPQQPPRRGRLRHPKLGWQSGEYWRVETPHYQIVTNADAGQGVRLGRRLERLHTAWRQLFVRHWTTDRVLKARFDGPASYDRRYTRHRVVLFADREQYVKHLEPAEPQIAMSRGVYRDVDRTAYFFLGDARTETTWLHESTHQLFEETARVADRIGARQNFWIVEGAALYMESLRAYPDFCTVGGVDAARLQFARYRALNEKFYVPVDRFTRIGREQLQHDENIRKLYSQAAGLTHFLMDASGGRHRRAAVDLLAAVYAGRDNPETLSGLTGLAPDALDREYFRSLQVTNDDLLRLAIELRRADALDAAERPRMRKLCLGHTAVDDRGLAALASMPELDWLDLAHTKTTDAGIAHLAGATQLKQLNLEGTQITDRALDTIGRLKSLEELDLSNTRITDAATEQLARLTNLKILWLEGTKITPAAREKLEHR